MDIKKYKITIKNNKYLTETQRKQLIRLIKVKKNSFGINNVEYKYLIYDIFILANNKYYNNYRLQTLFYEYFKKKSAINMFEYMAYLINTNKRLTNTEVMYNIIKKEFKNKINLKSYNIKWSEIVEKMILITNKYKYNSTKMLNFEYGKDDKAEIIRKQYRADKSDMYRTNIIEYKVSNFCLLENNKTSFPDNMFKIIFCIQVLHKCSNIKETIDELYRILEPGGILVVVEHDCYTEFDVKLIHLKYMFNNLYNNKSNNDLNVPYGYTYLYNAFEFDTIMEPFKFINAKNLFASVDLKIMDYDNSLLSFYKK